jgi:hypothetical protein
VARTACQVYNDATLTAYYPFDTNGTIADHGANLFTGYTTGTSVMSPGRIQDALLFSQNTSCFQAQCFTSPRYNNAPFSMSLWVYPTVVSSGSIVHVSPNQQGNGTSCFDLLAFTAAGAVVAQLYQAGVITAVINGPVLVVNTWAHLAVVYSFSNSFQLFVNGQEYVTATVSPVWSNTAVNPLYVTLGNTSPSGSSAAVNCPSSSLLAVPGSYKGAIDDFRLYSRQLTSQEICVLANM